MLYKDIITQEMERLGQYDNIVFIGQGITDVYGTMKNVPTSKCIEMPICENLMVGVAIGLALRGIQPVVVFQRMDFMLIAADAIINHLSMLPALSGNQFNLPVIIRAVVGSRDPMFEVGSQHQQDYSEFFGQYIKMYKVVCKNGINFYEEARKSYEPSLVVEYKDLYNKEL